MIRSENKVTQITGTAKEISTDLVFTIRTFKETLTGDYKYSPEQADAITASLVKMGIAETTDDIKEFINEN